MSMTMSVRLQVLIAPEQAERLRAAAERRGVSVATLVREGIEHVAPVVDDEVEAAWERLFAAEPIPVPDDPADLKREILAAHDARFPDFL
jgi:predicted DNA-binding protein